MVGTWKQPELLNANEDRSFRAQVFGRLYGNMPVTHARCYTEPAPFSTSHNLIMLERNACIGDPEFKSHRTRL